MLAWFSDYKLEDLQELIHELWYTSGYNSLIICGESSEEIKSIIDKVLKDIEDIDLRNQFETNPDKFCGVEIESDNSRSLEVSLFEKYEFAFNLLNHLKSNLNHLEKLGVPILHEMLTSENKFHRKQAKWFFEFCWNKNQIPKKDTEEIE